MKKKRPGFRRALHGGLYVLLALAAARLFGALLSGGGGAAGSGILRALGTALVVCGVLVLLLVLALQIGRREQADDDAPTGEGFVQTLRAEAEKYAAAPPPETDAPSPAAPPAPRKKPPRTYDLIDNPADP